MKKRMKVAEMISKLKQESIHTWFDLGIFIDRFKEHKSLPSIQLDLTKEEFSEKVCRGGMAFITFLYSVDGVTIEVEKYAKIFRKMHKNIPIHYIAGKFYQESKKLLHPETVKYELPQIGGFNDWDLYQDFFFTKLERGSEQYNSLIKKFWDQVLSISEHLGSYIEKNNINLLYLINVCSNPGNVSLALAMVLISEYLGIPVINNNHDFYWEGGNRQIDIEHKKLKHGPRDFFFTNSHLGEIFSLIEILYPWESRTWVNVNINKEQSKHLIEINGHNPANVTEIGTAVDTEEYVNISKRKKINAYHQFEKILARYSDTLVGYSVSDVIKNTLVDENNPRPILMGLKTKTINNFLNENIIFLQPTRIITRKRIELGFKLLKRMFINKDFIQRLLHTPNLKITLIVTGPIALGHYEYFKKLIRRFSQLLDVINESLRDRVYLAFLFSELDRESFKERFIEPVGIPELYNIASLVLLPSKTEGRGLPIIEATACGTPIYCTRYFPEFVYSEVIGEHLPESDRLKVLEFDGKKVTSKHANQIIARVLFPHKFTEEILHNKEAVQKRFSLLSLEKNIIKICDILFDQLKPADSSMNKMCSAMKDYKKMVNFSNNDLKSILHTKNRQYLPGFGRLSFMLNLRSLIDPSSFRVEEQLIKGFAHHFAKSLIHDNKLENKLSIEKIREFYNAVDNIFYYRNKEIKIRHDHSFAYRHRNKYYYPYRDFTIQEITGLINLLFYRIIRIKIKHKIDESSHFFTDWDLALAQLTSSSQLAIDDRKLLIDKMHTNIPIGIFPGDYIKYVLEFFALQSVRSRLKLKIEKELTDEILEKTHECLAPVYVFAQERFIGRRFNKQEIIDYIENGHERELKVLYRHNILRIVESKQLCVGIHFPQVGEESLKALKEIYDLGGFIISNRTFASIMTDIVNIDRFHIGKATHPVTANILGIPLDSGFIQYVPAGIRATLSYPTPVQTAKDFDSVLKGKQFKQLSNKYGETKLLELLREDAETKGSPVQYVLNKLSGEQGTKDDSVYYDNISGLYADGLPWNGVYARINVKNKAWKFKTVISSTKPKTVTSFVTGFARKTGIHADIAWNGGYILNPELVGKLGISESFIGSPLGLLISDGKVECPPLFNKAAFLIFNDGRISINKVNVKKGISVSYGKTCIQFPQNQYNRKIPGNRPCYYDLLYGEEEIFCKNRVIVRLAGNKIKEIIKPGKIEKVKIIPVGITLSFPAKSFPREFNKLNTSLEITINGLENIIHAIEAGPLLVVNGKISINMKNEGWKHLNSIRTQAARLDYIDMRGPKISIGLDSEGNLFVLTINGRIRESVGATHVNMAEILLKLGIKDAMGFDPGGSSTLVVNGKVLNISPYNSAYDQNMYALPPEPRAVSNVIIGYQKA